MSIARQVIQHLAVVLAFFTFYDSGLACVCGEGYVESGSTYSVNATGGPAPGATMAEACAYATRLARTSQLSQAQSGCTATGGIPSILGEGGTLGTCNCSMFGGQYYCGISITSSSAQCCVPE